MEVVIRMKVNLYIGSLSVTEEIMNDYKLYQTSIMKCQWIKPSIQKVGQRAE